MNERRAEAEEFEEVTYMLSDVSGLETNTQTLNMLP